MAGTRSGRTKAAVLAPYLPRIALEWDGKSDERWRTVEASLAFVDVSGFTALSERLAAQGRAGAEEITELLGACFTELLADAYLQGGSLLKFGGDALLLIFDGEGHAARAALAAAAMRRTTRRVGDLKTSVGNVRLRTSAGVHSGEVHLFRVGKSHHELIVTGPTSSHVLEMEAAAQAGQVVVSRATAAALDPSLIGDEHPPGFALRDRAVRPRRTEFPTAPTPPADLEAAVPVALRPHLLAGTVEPEHRHVAIAFIGYRLDHEFLASVGAAGAADALEELVTSVQDAVDHYGVTFLGTDIDRHGGKILLAAGAPEARDDDSGRMLGALRQIADTPRALPVRVGVNRGTVFVGDIGPEYRRTYTVMGDAVNLAARLMTAAADGEILATEELMATARRAYDTTARAPLSVKGKAAAVRAFSVGNPSRLDSRSGTGAAPLAPLVGRAAEMDHLLWALAAAQTGRGSTVEITGPAGIGKSRLVAEFCHRSPEVETVSVAAEPYEQTTPWSLFGRFIRSALALETHDVAKAAQTLGALAAFSPRAVPWAPLLGDVLGIPMPPTREMVDLEPRFAARRTYDAIEALLTTRFAGSAVFVFEDLQWADEASLAAVRELSQVVDGGRRWLIVLTRRTAGEGSQPEHHSELRLAALDETASREFVDAATVTSPLRPHRRDAVVRSAAGNPLFLEELLRAGTAGADEALPDSVQAAVASALDRLPPEDRRLLRHAAVLGVEFDYDTFARVAGEPVPPIELLALRWSGLTEAAGPNRLRFNSQLVRDVAYESLPFRKRRELHGTAGDVIEAATEGDDRPVELLSLHFLNAQRHAKCWTYSVAAAGRARRVRANAECVRLLDRALSIVRHVPHLDSEAVGDVWIDHANALHNLGEYERAEASYRQARRLLAASPTVVADTLSCEARIAELQGKPTTAVRRLRRAIRAVAESDLSARADLEVLLGWVLHRSGRQREAKRSAEQALTSARVSSNRRALAEANLLFDWTSLHLGGTGSWEHAADALALFEELGDLNRAAFTLNAMGAFAYYAGRWDEAAHFYSRSLETYERAGNDGDAAQARYNAAEILLDQRRLTEAQPMLEEVQRVYRSVGYRAGIALTNRDLGRIAAQTGDFEGAAELLGEAREAFADLQAAGRVMEVEVWIADLLRRRGRLAEALELVNSLAERARRSGSALLTPAVERLRGQIDAASGRLDHAQAALDSSLEAARAAGADHEVAMTLEAMAEASRAAGRADPSLESERAELFDRLGIVAAPTGVDAATINSIEERPAPVT